jgi:VanZ family protein
MHRKEIVFGIPILLYLGIFLISSVPGSALPAKIPDVIPHFCEYAILAFFFIRIFNHPVNVKTMAIGLAWLILLGLLDELHQVFVPGRFFTLEDLLYDTFGSLSGLLAYRMLWHRKVQNKSKKRMRTDQE